MDAKNELRLSGTVFEKPVLSHVAGPYAIYSLKLCVERLSGNCDLLNVLAPEHILRSACVGEGDEIEITGQLRSFNDRSAECNKLKISAYAFDIKPHSGIHENSIILNGSICKTPVYRQTPYGREICDIMLAVPRPGNSRNPTDYRRFDYIPCIMWGSVARMCSTMEPKTRLGIEGRLQSRLYIKNVDGEAQSRTAYEVSVSHACVYENDLRA